MSLIIVKTRQNCTASSSLAAYKIDAFVVVNETDDQALMQAIDELGFVRAGKKNTGKIFYLIFNFTKCKFFQQKKRPCAASIDINGDGHFDEPIYPEFLNYKSGIYSRECKVGAYNTDHAVLVVGYGTSSDGIPYWIIRCFYIFMFFF
jgi:hypothetical protein